MPPRKSKLTLSVDTETVTKAKDLGINISELTESILRTFTFDFEDASYEAIMDEYKTLFQAVQPALKKYNVMLRVGSIGDDLSGYQSNIYLRGDGKFWVEQDDVISSFEELHSQHPIFLDPNEILGKFVDTLERAKRESRERLESLSLARRIIEAIAQGESQAKSEKNRTERPDVEEEKKDAGS